jgi:hypothetical protein
MTDGVTIIRLIYKNLRNPSDTALPYQTAVEKLASVVRMKKLDLTLGEQNNVMKISEWFRPTSNDFALSEFGLSKVMLPIAVSRRVCGTAVDYNTVGADVPVVNYQVLSESHDGAVSFYGSPLRMIFRHGYYNIGDGYEYRIAYETDFTDEIELDGKINLPDYFVDMLAAEASYLLAPLVEDNSEEWRIFLNMQMPILQNQIMDWRMRWEKLVKKTAGKADVQKRTIFDRRNRNRFTFHRVITR